MSNKSIQADAHSARQDEKNVIWDLNSRLVFLTGLLLIAGAMITIAYSFTLPTDGWSVYTTELEDSNWLFDANLVGAPSELQSGDELLSIDGLSLKGTASLSSALAPANWVVGKSVTYIVRRAGQEVSVAVPVVHWTGAALWRNNAGTLSDFLDNLGSLIFLFIGWFTFLRRPGVPSARALFLLSTASGAAGISSLLPDGLSVQFNQTAFYLTGYFSYAIIGTLFAPSLLAFALLFPRPKLFLQRRPWLGLAPYVLGLLILVYLVAGGTAVAGWVGALSMVIASIASLIHAYFTQRDPVSRAQLRWAVSGFVLGLGLFSLNFPLALGWVKDPQLLDPLLVSIWLAVTRLASPIIGIGLSVAVLRYRLYDIDVIIRKTLQYTLLTAMLGLVYFGMAILLERVLSLLVGRGGQVATVVSTLSIAALFTPLRRRVQQVIDQRFYRSKYNAEQALAEFAATARNETDLEALTAQVVNIVQATMQPEQVSLWLRSDEKARAGAVIR